MEKWSIEKAVARVLQALMFVVCYALTRLIANKTYWHSDTASSAAGEWILIVFLFFLYIWTGYHVVPEAMMNASVHFALPPYVDNTNWMTAVLCQKHADDLARGLRESTMPTPRHPNGRGSSEIEEFDLTPVLDMNSDGCITRSEFDTIRSIANAEDAEFIELRPVTSGLLPASPKLEAQHHGHH